MIYSNDPGGSKLNDQHLVLQNMVTRMKYNLATLVLAFMAFTTSTQANEPSIIEFHHKPGCSSEERVSHTIEITYPYMHNGCAQNAVCNVFGAQGAASVRMSDWTSNTTCDFYEDKVCGQYIYGYKNPYYTPPTHTKSVSHTSACYDVTGSGGSLIWSARCVREPCRVIPF